MTTKEAQTEKPTNVYIPRDTRKLLATLVTEIGYRRGKVLSESGFVRYLIEEFGEKAKEKMITRG